MVRMCFIQLDVNVSFRNVVLQQEKWWFQLSTTIPLDLSLIEVGNNNVLLIFDLFRKHHLLYPIECTFPSPSKYSTYLHLKPLQVPYDYLLIRLMLTCKQCPWQQQFVTFLTLPNVLWYLTSSWKLFVDLFSHIIS